MISRHLPLITNRIRFSSGAVPSLPTITPRVSLPLPHSKVPLRKRDERELTPSEDGIIEESALEDQPVQLSLTSDGESELSELSEPESEDDSHPLLQCAQKILQPSGQPGRPGSGGYSIEEALKAWSKEELAKVMAFTKKLADTKLDQSLSYSKQGKEKVNTLCETVARNYPIVSKYEDHWPVRGILKLHLKATSESFRRGRNQRQGGKANK